MEITNLIMAVFADGDYTQTVYYNREEDVPRTVMNYKNPWRARKLWLKAVNVTSQKEIEEEAKKGRI